MKARAIKTSPHFDGMFDIGTEVEMINVPYEEDTILVYGIAVLTIGNETIIRIKHDGKKEFPDASEFEYVKNNFTKEQIESAEWSVLEEPTIAKKGSFKDLYFKLPDGRVYDTDIIYRFTGKTFPEFFEKID